MVRSEECEKGHNVVLKCFGWSVSSGVIRALIPYAAIKSARSQTSLVIPAALPRPWSRAGPSLQGRSRVPVFLASTKAMHWSFRFRPRYSVSAYWFCRETFVAGVFCFFLAPCSLATWRAGSAALPSRANTTPPVRVCSSAPMTASGRRLQRSHDVARNVRPRGVQVASGLTFRSILICEPPRREPAQCAAWRSSAMDATNSRCPLISWR